MSRLFKRLFRKKRVFRALIMTVVLVTFLTLFNSVIEEKTALLFILMIALCIIIDFLAVRMLKSSKLRKYFFEGGADQ